MIFQVLLRLLNTYPLFKIQTSAYDILHILDPNGVSSYLDLYVKFEIPSRILSKDFFRRIF